MEFRHEGREFAPNYNCSNFFTYSNVIHGLVLCHVSGCTSGKGKIKTSLQVSFFYQAICLILIVSIEYSLIMQEFLPPCTFYYCPTKLLSLMFFFAFFLTYTISNLNLSTLILSFLLKYKINGLQRHYYIINLFQIISAI